MRDRINAKRWNESDKDNLSLRKHDPDEFITYAQAAVLAGVKSDQVVINYLNKWAGYEQRGMRPFVIRRIARKVHEKDFKRALKWSRTRRTMRAKKGEENRRKEEDE